MRSIDFATADDLGDVLSLLNTAARWLKSRGIDQWGAGFDASRIGPMIDRREIYLVRESSKASPIAMGSASWSGDPDFWTPDELVESALYLNKVAIARAQAGRGLGTLLFRWLIDRAATEGAEWVRLDAWRTNHELHAYYRRTGWTYVRTEVRDHRRSGALFQRRAVEDPVARHAFLYQGTTLNADADYTIGDRVVFDVDGQLQHGKIVTVWPPEWEADMYIRPSTAYTIQAGDHRYDRGHSQVRRPAPQ